MRDRIGIAFGNALHTLRGLADDQETAATVETVVRLCVNRLGDGKKIMIAGNGGSAADAQHWAGELVSRFNYDRPGLPAIALSTDSSILSAIGNDYGYEYVFARQVEALGKEGDILFAISTSGGSRNILDAISAARKKGIAIVSFTGAGKSADKLKTLSDHCFQVPSTHTPRIQEGHELLGHLICGLIEEELFPRG